MAKDWTAILYGIGQDKKETEPESVDGLCVNSEIYYVGMGWDLWFKKKKVDHTP